MKYVFFALLYLLIITTSFSQQYFPDLSPKGSIKQKVGFTTITVQYERPAARGRKILGGLVPYKKLWRTGSGYCTKIKFSDSVKVEGKPVMAGTYSLFTIPDVNEWTIILNSDTSLFATDGYDEKKNVARFETPTEKSSRYYESLTIDVDVIPNNASISIAWEKILVSFKVETSTDRMVNDFIAKNLLTDKSKDANEYAMAAEYYLFLNKELDKAVILANKGIAQDPTVAWSYGLKVDILEKQGKYPEAILAAKAMLEFDQTYGKKIGWDAEQQRTAIAGANARIESLNKKVKK